MLKIELLLRNQVFVLFFLTFLPFVITKSHRLTFEDLKFRVTEEKEHVAFVFLNLVTTFNKIISGSIH